jgi:hypothetical protein
VNDYYLVISYELTILKNKNTNIKSKKGKCAMNKFLSLDNPNDDVPYVNRQQKKQAKENQDKSSNNIVNVKLI